MSAASVKLLVATTNRKKLIELKTLLADLNFELLCLADLPGYQEVSETGSTFRENASLKALGYARQTGYLTLGEDSGLCCDALDGAPGVYSARFAGESKDDRENNQKLLLALESVPPGSRGAYFASAVAIALPDRLIGVAEGRVHGVIGREVLGEHGFGYDPVFFYPPFERTFGQVPAEEKNRVSHRAEALRQAKELLKNFLHHANSQSG